MSSRPPTPTFFELDIESVPMDPCHRELILRHYSRLTHIIHERDEAAIGNYTNKQATREQLARMALVIRDYAALNKDRCSSSSDEACIESMVSDIVDASFSLTGTQSTWSQTIFITPQLWGREQEIAALMQEIDAESGDDVLELWTLVPEKSDKVVPGVRDQDKDLAKDVDWNYVLCRSRSENHLLHYRQEFEIHDPETWRKELQHRELEQLDLIWPPAFKDPEPNLGRQRLRSRANSMTNPRGDLTIDRILMKAASRCDECSSETCLPKS